jgi:hypothetical protein
MVELVPPRRGYIFIGTVFVWPARTVGRAKRHKSEQGLLTTT